MSLWADHFDDLTGGWRTETTLNNGNQQVRQVIRILRSRNGRFVSIINHQPSPGQKQPPELPLNVIGYGTWAVEGDQLTTEIQWVSDKRFATPPTSQRIVSITGEESIFDNGGRTVVRKRHPWTLEEEMGRTAELAGFAQDQSRFYKEQADYKPILGRDRETGVVVVDGDEMPSPNAVKGLSRNQNREAAAKQKLAWLTKAKEFLGEGSAKAAAVEAIAPTPSKPNERKGNALTYLRRASSLDANRLPASLVDEVNRTLESAKEARLEELLVELEALKEPTERNRKAFLRFWMSEYPADQK